MPTRRSGPRDFETERTSAHRGCPGGIMDRYSCPDSCQKWSSSMMRTCGYCDNSAANARARAAEITAPVGLCARGVTTSARIPRSEEHTSELQSRGHLVCRLLLEKKNELSMMRRS